MNLKTGDVFYYLYRGCYNPNDKEELIIKMKVIEKNGQKEAISLSEKVHWISFPIDDATMKGFERAELPQLFITEEEALNQYEKEFTLWKESVLNLSKEELLTNLYRSWENSFSSILDAREYETMKEKIKHEFDVTIE